MEKRYYDFSEMNQGQSKSLSFQRCGECSDNAGCYNNDFCLPTPSDIVGGTLTMVFADMQPLESVYPLETALCKGTLFPNLNKPFYGGRSR